MFMVIDIHASPIARESNPQRMKITKNCPCDKCPDKVGCLIECKIFNIWIHTGRTRRAKK